MRMITAMYLFITLNLCKLKKMLLEMYYFHFVFISIRRYVLLSYTLLSVSYPALLCVRVHIKVKLLN
jgi:hypothetical protein